MSDIKIKDLTFTPYISREEIAEAIKKVAAQINNELADKNPLFICVLNGAFMFASDLMKEITIDCEITFMRIKSYEGTQSSGTIKQIYGLEESIHGRTVVIIEDIVDTGHTMTYIVKQLLSQEPEQVKIATLLFKPQALMVPLEIDYVAIEIPNAFIVGYGLDYNEHGRNLKDIYILKK